MNMKPGKQHCSCEYVDYHSMTTCVVCYLYFHAWILCFPSPAPHPRLSSGLCRMETQGGGGSGWWYDWQAFISYIPLSVLVSVLQNYKYRWNVEVCAEIKAVLWKNNEHLDNKQNTIMSPRPSHDWLVKCLYYCFQGGVPLAPCFFSLRL